MATPITCCGAKFLKCEYNLIRSDLERRTFYILELIYSYSYEKMASFNERNLMIFFIQSCVYLKTRSESRKMILFSCGGNSVW